MSKLNDLADIYASYHQSKINQIFHIIGIPIIVLSLLMMSNWFTISFFSHGSVFLSWLLIAAIGIYYLQLDTKVASILVVIYLVLNFIAIGLSLLMANKTQIIVAFALFIIGWILNFIGHAIEGRKPAFLHNLFQTLIAPIFIVDEICKFFGWSIIKTTKDASSETDTEKES